MLALLIVKDNLQGKSGLDKEPLLTQLAALLIQSLLIIKLIAIFPLKFFQYSESYSSLQLNFLKKSSNLHPSDRVTKLLYSS